ncbi:MAG: leucine-rich repeat protein [Bacteroidales bacterium]|nr:leucine-rich repeat protein [Bacteroidales bacterium]
MKRHILFILFVQLVIKLSLTAIYAVNAYPLPITVKQPNGASLSILMRGDELFHYQTTTDGYLLETNAEGYLTYAKVDDTGKIISSGIIASDIEKRTPKETLFLKECTKADNMKALREEEKLEAQQASRSIGMSEQIQGGVLSPFANNSPRVLVLLVNFSDVQFVTPSANSAFSNLLNKEGYNINGATGSARDYFMASSFGQFRPTFDVFGPVTLPNPMSYYGQSANSSVKYDANPKQMVSDACSIAQKEGVDLRNYDTNGDRYVDNVFIIYAGYNQAEGGSKDAIWPHMGIAKETYLEFDMRLKRYACSSELKGNTGSEMCGIGTFCHEFSHVIGLQDLYHTVSDKSTLGYWSIMSNGSYNNGSRTPPTYSCYERFYLGYFKPDQARTPDEITLYPLSQEITTSVNTSNQSFIVSKGKHNQDPIYPSPNEFFMVEYRKRTGWDRYLPGEGMLIWHIDYNKEAWLANTINNFSGEKQTAASHMRVYLQPLNGSTETPGAAFTSGEFIPTTWQGYELNQNISSITKTNESVTFKFTSYPVLCNIETPGTLSTVIPRTSIFSLALTGVIDARDIKYMRDNLPYLGYLDLSGVTIESYTEPSGTGYYPANELPERSFYRSGVSARDTILKTIILPTSITSIGKHAFEGCIFLDSISIPYKTTSIGDSAFFNCRRLSYVTIPASTTFIGRGAFSGCPWNNSQPTGLVYMGKVAYKYVGDMLPGTSITLAAETTSISDSAFANCTNLISITIPKGVTSIGRSAFDGCSGLTSLTIPSGITSIWERAFKDCNGLTSLTIPESVTTIDAYAFNGCSKLKSIKLSSNIRTIDRYAFSDCKELTSLTIPGKVFFIGEGAFYGCQKLASVVCPASLKVIENRAFYNCSALTSLIPPSNVEFIGRSAFSNTAWFNKLADGLVTIGKAVYKYKGVMPANTSVTLPEDTRCITDSAFYGCSGLISIILPESVTKIGEYAFSNCRDLSSLTLPTQITTLAKGIFEYCTKLRSVIIPENVTSIGASAFYYCLSLPSITIPNKVTAINSRAFGRCPKLVEMYCNGIIPPELDEDCFDDSNKRICSVFVPAKSFFTYLARNGWKDLLLMGHYDIKMTTPGELLDIVGLDNLKYVSVLTLTGPVNGKDMLMVQTQFPHLIKLDMTNATIVSGGYVYTTTDNQIGDYMFYNLKNLETVALPTTVTSIGNYAFSGCTSLKSITIPSFVTTIGNFAFENCSGMEYVSFPNTITSIGIFAFSDCSSLTSLTIPPEVTTIGYYSFYNCTGLTSIMIPSKVTSIRTHAFAFCNNIKAIYTLNPDPPTVYIDAFEEIDKIECTLHIPPGSYQKYYPADGWSEFLNFNEKCMTDENISESDPVSLFVQDNRLVIRGADPGVIITIYSVSGVPLLSLIADGEEQQISLPTGALYFVKVGHQTLKIAL